MKFEDKYGADTKLTVYKAFNSINNILFRNIRTSTMLWSCDWDDVSRMLNRSGYVNREIND